MPPGRPNDELTATSTRGVEGRGGARRGPRPLYLGVTPRAWGRSRWPPQGRHRRPVVLRRLSRSAGMLVPRAHACHRDRRRRSLPSVPPGRRQGCALDPTGETCNQDPQLTEVGLDFSMMAPLPHDQQRPDALGSGLTDLLGIAPGASYRLVIPGTAGGAVSDVDAAFLAAANQTPHPNVITASLSFGLDQFGFSSRYLDEDPMTESIIAAIVHGDGIVVCVSSGDGLRTFTNSPVAPSGGADATDLAGHGVAPTDINDVAFSGAISRVLDSGSIDVGGSTLNDIFSFPPGDPRNAALRA